MKTETITWHELPADGLPDADLTVLMQVNDCDGLPATEVWQGWWTGDDWLDAATAMPVARHLVRDRKSVV